MECLTSPCQLVKWLSIVGTISVYFILRSLEAECQKPCGENQAACPKIFQKKILAREFQ
jgi:hypothetical protein